LVTGIISHQTLTAVIYSLDFVLRKLLFVPARIIIYGPLSPLRCIVNTTPFSVRPAIQYFWLLF